MVSKLIKCPKCGGRGYIPSYAHVDGGICFQCSGSGVVDKIPNQTISKFLKSIKKRSKTI